MKVFWTPEALQDRLTIWDSIAKDNAEAAARMDALFSDAATRLTDYPMLGRAGKIPGVREMFPHRHYRLVYQVKDDGVWILTLLHTARLWPPLPRLVEK